MTGHGLAPGSTISVDQTQDGPYRWPSASGLQTRPRRMPRSESVIICGLERVRAQLREMFRLSVDPHESAGSDEIDVAALRRHLVADAQLVLELAEARRRSGQPPPAERDRALLFLRNQRPVVVPPLVSCRRRPLTATTWTGSRR